MSLMPDFELGVWNGWILMLYVIFYNILPYIFSMIKPKNKEILKKASGLDIQFNKNEKKLNKIISLVFIIPIIYSVFLPIKLFTFWFYIGLIVYLIGIVIGTLSMYDFYTTAVDSLVTKGFYQISRNPIYLGMFLIYIGIGIACTSWLFLLFTIIFILLTHLIVIIEESYCLNKYGEVYREYLKRIPRWIGIPK